MRSKTYEKYVKEEDFDFTKKNQHLNANSSEQTVLSSNTSSTDHTILRSDTYYFIKNFITDCLEESFLLSGISFIFCIFSIITLFMVCYYTILFKMGFDNIYG